MENDSAISALPGLDEVAVVGVPDDRWGEVGHLAMVALLGAASSGDGVRAHLEGQLARYKMPRRVTVLNSLPRNGAGKVLKAQLRDLIAVARA